MGQRKSLRSLILTCLLFGMIVTLSGCFGGKSKPSTPPTNVTRLTGTIVAPSGTPVAFAPRSRNPFVQWLDPVAYALSGQAVAGARVIAIDFSDGKTIGGPVTADSNGSYTISNLPSGKDVLIVASKETASGTIRLSTLVPDVSGSSGSADIDATTSLAAEAMAVNYGKGQNVVAGDVQPVLDAARTFVSGLATLDLTVGGPAIPTVVGGGLGTGIPGLDVIVETAKSSPAKAMVRSLRDASLSASGILASEVRTESEDITENVAPYLETVLDATSGLHDAILSGLIAWADSGTYTESGLDDLLLDMEQSGAMDGPSPANPNGTWTIEMEDGTTQHATMATVGDFQTIDFEITKASDPTYEQSGTLSQSIAAPDPGATATISASMTLRGPFTTVPVSFDGTIDAVFDEDGYMTAFDLEGDFASQRFNASGTLSASKFADMPIPEQISFSGTARTTATYTGTMSFRFVENPYDVAWPSRVTFTGRYASAAGVSTNGTLDFQITNADTYQSDDPADYLDGSVTYDGSLAAPQRPTTAVNLVITPKSASTYEATAEYTRGAETLTGTICWNETTKQAVLHLTSEKGLVLNLTLGLGSSRTASGTVKDSQGDTLANFSVESGIYMVTYSDDTFESLI